MEKKKQTQRNSSFILHSIWCMRALFSLLNIHCTFYHLIFFDSKQTKKKNQSILQAHKYTHARMHDWLWRLIMTRHKCDEVLMHEKWQSDTWCCCWCCVCMCEWQRKLKIAYLNKKKIIAKYLMDFFKIVFLLCCCHFIAFNAIFALRVYCFNQTIHHK